LLWEVASGGEPFALVRTARRYMKSCGDPEALSEATAKRYARNRTNMLQWTEEDWLGWTRSTRRNKLAAARHHCVRLIQHRLRLLDRLRRTGERDQLDLETVRLGTILLVASGIETWAHRVAEPAKQKARPKARINGLPDDWTDQVIRSLRADCKWRLSAAIMAIFGARPAELEKGVGLSWDPVTREMTADIQGAKVTKGKPGKVGTGQDRRHVTMQLDDSHTARLLIEACEGHNGRVRVTLPNRKTFDRGLAGRLKALFPGRGLTPYSMRHQFAANLKTAGEPPETIAKSMGHQAVGTQAVYGSQRTGGRGGTRFVRVDASEPVRTKSKTKPWGPKNQPPNPGAQSGAPKP
jgi:integrase